jgi:hypothetical protein
MNQGSWLPQSPVFANFELLAALRGRTSPKPRFTCTSVSGLVRVLSRITPQKLWQGFSGPSHGPWWITRTPPQSGKVRFADKPPDASKVLKSQLRGFDVKGESDVADFAKLALLFGAHYYCGVHWR